MSKRILVVEDDDAIRMACNEILLHWGHDVQLAENGEEALQKLAVHSKPIDLILLDSMMPQMTGEQFIAIQKKHPQWKGIPVVVMSALSELPPGLQGERWLRKPMNLQELKAALQ